MKKENKKEVKPMLFETSITLPASNKEVIIRKPKGKDVNILMNEELRKLGKNIDGYLESITNLSEDELKALMTPERFILLVKARMLDKGNMLYPRILAPSGKFKKEKVDLSKMEYKKFDKKLFREENGQYVFDVTLPISGKKLVAKLQTGKEEELAIKYRDKYKDDFYCFLMMLRTVKIEGLDMKRFDFFTDLYEEDIQHFRAEYNKRNFGYDFTQIGSENGSSYRYEIPITEDFFLEMMPELEVNVDDIIENQAL